MGMKHTGYGYVSNTEQQCLGDLEHWLSEKRKQERLKKHKSDDDNGGKPNGK
ncbi:hypothetical protein LOSG293_110400 [Secundilactobacillus oryzae JCM 18671]|uniref:Uncharacterized protein n=1 Tax=Secundilactobacillus oryzae JCM 18671 TaxID=1291743 RepID=A0A081BI56_9LACO|nr:hypothetical protein [Secundilactobacillus oryzae]GAK47724.1 hypothetical protein LOSG293_110400 [Secundilactobacillus oryzae JCM 18671]